MNKVLIEVCLPAADRSYDVFVPWCLPLYEVLQLLKRMAAELSEGLLWTDEHSVLCYKSDGTLINLNLTAMELGLANGARLMLI